jgi:hypothetical protein
MKKKFVVEAGGGRLGNQMMQLMVANAITKDLADFEVCGYQMPEWRLSRPAGTFDRRFPVLVWMEAPLGIVAAFCKLGLTNYVFMRSVHLDYSWFPSKGEAASLFHPLAEDDVKGFDENHIVIHVRAEDALQGGHPDYGPIPIEYYKSILNESGLKPVFLGQLSDDYYSNMLRNAFPDALFVPPSSPIKDFQVMRNSKNIVISTSTFGWLAAWLSDAARIYMPLIGGFNPCQRPDINLTPLEDPRFIYDLFPVRLWRADPEQINALQVEHGFRRLTTDEVTQIRERQNRRLIPRRFMKGLQLTRYVLRQLAWRGIGLFRISRKT